jgi:hypothetical protein
MALALANRPECGQGGKTGESARAWPLRRHGLRLGGGLYLAPGSVVTLKHTGVFGNHASTAFDDIFGSWSPGG